MLQDGKRSRLQANAAVGIVDTSTGEVIDEPEKYFRALWARRACGSTKQWPLPDLINGLTVKGLGPQAAMRIAATMLTWDRFVQALGQLQEIEIPSSRDEVHHRRCEAAIDQGLAITSTTSHHISVGKTDVVVRSTSSQVRSDTELPSIFPDPLAALIEETGPSLWKSLREWVDSPRSRHEIDELLQFGTPSPYESDNGRRFLRGAVIVFTGTLESMTREQAHRMVDEAGGIVHGSVSEATTFVVAGAGAGGTKMRRAGELDVGIWTEEEFLAAVSRL